MEEPTQFKQDERVLRAFPQPLQQQPQPQNEPARKSDPHATTKELARFFASELDPRLIADWPEQFQRSCIRAMQAVATFRHIKFNDVIMGVVQLCLLFTFATTFSATIFNEAGLTQYVALGTGCTLMAIVCVQGSFAVFSDNGISIGGPEITPTVMLAQMAGQMRQYMTARNKETGAALNQEVMLTTLLALIMITTACFGVVIYTLGRLKLSKIIRLIPAAVLAGYMASIGYLVTVTAMKTSMPTPVFNAGPSQGMWWAYFMPSVVVGLSMYFQRRFKIGNPALVLPFILFSPIVLFYIIVYASGSNVTQAALDGWLFVPFRSEIFYNQFAYSYGRAYQVDWDAIGSVAASIFVMMFVVTLESVMKQAATKKLLKAFDMRIDHELMLVGKANMLCSLFVGAVGYPQPKLTFVAYGIVRNTTTRIGGMLVALVVLILWFASFPLVNYLPRFWLSAVLIFAASGFIIDNLFDGLWIYTKKEYFCMAAIVCVNATVGMAWAVVAGVILSALIFAFSYSLQGSIKSIMLGSRFRSNVLRNERADMKLEHLGQRVLVIQLHRFVFFGNASYLNEVLMGLIKEQDKCSDEQRATHFVIDWAHVDSVDITAASVIYELVCRIGCEGRKVFFTGLGPKLAPKLQASIREIHDAKYHAKSGAEVPLALPETGPDQRVFATLDDGVAFVEEELLRWSRDIRKRWFKLESFEDFHILSQLRNALELEQDLAYFSHVRVPKGWTLCVAGEVDENLYILKEGTLAVYAGGTRTHVLKPGCFVNEGALSLQALPLRTIKAEEDCVVLALSPEDMVRLEHDLPALSFELHRKVLDHSVRTREKIATRLEAFKLWSRERVSKLAQANAVAPRPHRSLRGVDLEAGPETNNAAVSPREDAANSFGATVDQDGAKFDPDLTRSLLQDSESDAALLKTVRDGAGEEAGRDIAQQLFAEDESVSAQATFVSRMKRHSSAVSQLYPLESSHASGSAAFARDVPGAILHCIHQTGHNSEQQQPQPVYRLCSVMQQRLDAAFEALAVREAPLGPLELPVHAFKQAFAAIGICYRGSEEHDIALGRDDFIDLATRLVMPALDESLVSKLAAFSHGGNPMSEAALRRALPFPAISSLAISKFVRVWGNDDVTGESRQVDFSALCSSIALHMKEADLKRRVELDWNALSNGGMRMVTAEDVATVFACSSVQAEEMVWEADWGRKGGLDLLDLLETLAV